MTKNIIEIINLSYKDIFNNFSLAIEEGKFISLVGPNNSGKTTLLRILDRQIDIKNSIILAQRKLEDYKVTDLPHLIKAVIPKEIIFINNTVEEELYFYIQQINLSKEERNKRYKKVIKDLKISRILNKQSKNLTESETIKLQVAIALLIKPKILLLDNIGAYLSKSDAKELVTIIRKYKDIEKMTIIMVTSNLAETLLSDYIYVINESDILIEGQPIDVIQKDNVMNKAGLNLPFMIDLSVKLRDYDLVKEIEQHKERMVELLWK